MIITETERALRLATEHAEWARENGQGPEDILLGLGAKRWEFGSPTWADAIDAMVTAWLALT